MDDSDQDFEDLSSKLLKRVRKKPGETRPPRKAGHPPTSSQSREDNKKKRNQTKDGESGSKVTASQSGDTGLLFAVPSISGTERGMSPKEKVLLRMQQFKRRSPQRLVHVGPTHTAKHENVPQMLPQEPSTSDLGPDCDEALALRLQQEMDREAADAEVVALEDRGLFFCQICHKDLSHMNPEGRTQHLNRCLDESEESGPPPPPPPPGVPECPICGKKFKSQKSRSAHLKRCSSDMGVPPAVLLQALHRQAEETQDTTANSACTQTGATKRKGSDKASIPARKKPRKKSDPLDEDAMVALALSSSLLEQEKEAQRELRTDAVASHISSTEALRWKPDAGKGRGRKKKGLVPRPPPLLLVQDAKAALARLQERVSALLLCSRAPSPPTPTLSPSSLSGLDGAAPLWQKSTLLDGGNSCPSDFYTQELRDFITPWETPRTDVAPSMAAHQPEPALQTLGEDSTLPGIRKPLLPPASQTPGPSSVPSTPGTEQLPVGSQVLRDLMELAEEGMTLSQYRSMSPDTNKDKRSRTRLSTNLPLSGFIPEEAEDQAADLCVSGFLPETAPTHSVNTHGGARRKSERLQADEEQGNQPSVALSKLALDLSSMVNNPQLSDVQIQVDNGDVYFAHSFMVYARCPLLAEMVHESGFGVQEEDFPKAHRVLMNDVPGAAVLALLQYLYTAQCSIPASLQPHVLELASRFDLQELRHLCEAPPPGEESGDANQDEHVINQTDQAFIELLRSMWNDEDEEDEEMDTNRDDDDEEEKRLEESRQSDDVASGEKGVCDEQVNEEELDEIYEFAATQRKREEEKGEEEEEESVDDGDEVFTKRTEAKETLKPNSYLEPDPSLDRSYSRLFSDTRGVYEESDHSSPSPCNTPTIRPPPPSQKSRSSPRPSYAAPSRTLLQSSPSVADDHSRNSPPAGSDLPVTGLSPDQVGDVETGSVEPDMSEERPLPTQERQVPHRVCVPASPDSSLRQKEPELIVLSDSSESSPSHCSPGAAQSLENYTHIKPPLPTEPIMENQVSSSLELNLSPASGQDGPVQSPDCSPEVSWLIPSTPVLQERSSRSTSTQTNSSMCRTRLFIKAESPVPSSPDHKRFRESALGGPAEGSLPSSEREKTDLSCSDADLKVFPKRPSSNDGWKNRQVATVSPRQPNHGQHHSSSSHHQLLQTSSKPDTPQRVQQQQQQPSSSTPLHTEFKQPPVLLAASPLNNGLHKPWWPRSGRSSASPGSPEKTELGSFHLNSPSSSPTPSDRGLQSSKSPGKSRHSAESGGHGKSGAELSVRDEGDGEREDAGDEGAPKEAKEESQEMEIAESSFHHSFMDEPPIAFNDSWGLDMCVDNNPGCFSLRLEDSKESDLQEQGQTGNAQPVPAGHSSGSMDSTLPKTHSAQPSTSAQAQRNLSLTPHNSSLDPKLWDRWDEEVEEDEVVPPLSQRLCPSPKFRTPASSHNKKPRRSLVPITPMPHYSDMDTPELKNKLNRYGVRPLPKRQMILKLREIHQYTHQLLSSDSEDEAPVAGPAQRSKPPLKARSVTAVTFKEPKAPAATSPLKRGAGERKEEEEEEGEGEMLSASQGSNTSSTAASEESERSNPELCLTSDDSDSDGGVPASQAETRLKDQLQAVRAFILSNQDLYRQILLYRPLVLCQLQQRLKEAGIRLGATKLADFLDSQCITFTTAKPGQPARSRHRKRTKTAGARGRKRILQV